MDKLEQVVFVPSEYRVALKNLLSFIDINREIMLNDKEYHFISFFDNKNPPNLLYAWVPRSVSHIDIPQDVKIFVTEQYRLLGKETLDGC